MDYNPLGNSDLNVSEIGFGCMSLVGTHEENSRIIHKALDKGINFFDTADRYDHGQNEETVGRALKDRRQEAVIATKVGHQLKADGSGWEWKPTKEHILSAVDESLERLQTDYIDLYQLHGGTLEDPIDDIIEAFERLKDRGKIREYGISSIRPNVIREYIRRSGIVSVMMQYSLLDRRPEEQCLDLLADAGISVVTRGSLAKGVLIDKAPVDMPGYSKEQVTRMQQAVNATGNAAGTALHFVLHHPAVATAAVGMRTTRQLEEVVEGYSNPVPEKVLEALGDLLPPNRYTKHR